MDLNHIELPSSLLADFYKKHLIESAPAYMPASAQAKKKTEKKEIQYLGENQKGVCLLVSYDKDVYLPDEQLKFLTSILQACSLNLGDVAIVNYFRENKTFEELRGKLAFNYLLVFGVEPSILGLTGIQLFTLQHVNDCKVVYSAAPELLNNNTADGKLLKSKLWTCLKQMFAV